MRVAVLGAGAIGARPSRSPPGWTPTRRSRSNAAWAGAERAGEHKTSTLRDLEKGRPLELDVILKAVVELADLTGAPAPTVRVVSALADLLNEQAAAAG